MFFYAQYDTGHELESMSADELMYHPVSSSNKTSSNLANLQTPPHQPDRDLNHTEEDLTLIHNMLCRLEQMEVHDIHVTSALFTRSCDVSLKNNLIFSLVLIV